MNEQIDKVPSGPLRRMAEQTDRSSKKPSKAVPKKRPAKTRSPKSKRAKAPGRPTARTKKDTAAKTSPSAAKKTAKTPETVSLAPDPATITFGSNRPIIAQPQKLPESSGLRFSGPSNGQLKASGPQPSSAKASGLTFSNSNSPGNASSQSPKPTGVNGSRALGNAKTAEARKAETEKKDFAANGKAEGAKTPGKKVFTKPAIAPQASGRRLERERSSRGFAFTLLGLVVVVAGLAYWLNPGTDPGATTGSPRRDLAALQPAPAPEFAAPQAAKPAPKAAADMPAANKPLSHEQAVSASATPKAEVPSYGPSQRAPVTPGPLVATAAPAERAAALSVVEVAEIQQLLQHLDLAPGNIDGVLTADTSAAIRSYQEMAGLNGDGEANRALLEELRSVVELYGG